MEYDRETALVHAWDFLEHWQKMLSLSDGEKRLEEFYRALVQFAKQENIHERYGQSR